MTDHVARMQACDRENRADALAVSRVIRSVLRDGIPDRPLAEGVASEPWKSALERRAVI